MSNLFDEVSVDSFLHSFHRQKGTMRFFLWEDADCFQYVFSSQVKELLRIFANGKLGSKGAA